MYYYDNWTILEVRYDFYKDTIKDYQKIKCILIEALIQFIKQNKIKRLKYRYFV